MAKAIFLVEHRERCWAPAFAGATGELVSLSVEQPLVFDGITSGSFFVDSSCCVAGLMFRMRERAHTTKLISPKTVPVAQNKALRRSQLFFPLFLFLEKRNRAPREAHRLEPINNGSHVAGALHRWSRLGPNPRTPGQRKSKAQRA